MSNCRRRFGSEAVKRFEDRDRSASAAAVGQLHRAAVRRRNRGIARAGHRRGPDLPQPPRARLRRHRLSRQPGSRCRAVGAGLPERRRDPRTDRPGSDRRSRGGGDRGRGECAAKGVPAVVVISAGFAEVGAEGTERQRELLEVCRECGVRLVGPNCLGIVNTAAARTTQRDLRPEHAAAWKRRLPLPERRAGACGDRARGRSSLGLSSFASVGNRADITAQRSARVLGVATTGTDVGAAVPRVVQRSRVGSRASRGGWARESRSSW